MQNFVRSLCNATIKIISACSISKRFSVAMLVYFLLPWNLSCIKIHTSIQTRPSTQHSWRWQSPTAGELKPSSSPYHSNSSELLNDPQHRDVHEFFDQREMIQSYPECRPINKYRRQLTATASPSQRFLRPLAQSTFEGLPPWYVNHYRRYPRDGNSQLENGATWQFRSHCRSCGKPMLQDSFCTDDFAGKLPAVFAVAVIRAFIYFGADSIQGDKEYTVYIQELYKDTKRRLIPMKYHRISKRCDRFNDGPSVSTVYLLTGVYINGRPSIDSCSWKAPWSEVSWHQRRFLRQKYQLHCGICHIQRVLRNEPAQIKRTDVCYVSLTPNPNELTCRDRFSLCRYRIRAKRCEFNHRSLYDACRIWMSRNN